MNKIEKALNFLRSYSMRVPLWIRLLVLMPCFVAPGYWALTFSGPYLWVAELQTGPRGGEYSAALAYLLPCLLLLLFAGALIIVVGNFFPEKPESETKMGAKNLWGL